MAPTTDWNPVLRKEFDKPYWRELMAFVRQERMAGDVYPPHEEVFAALHLTPLAEVKVLILGQDPYHGPRQAHGLCFSVRHGVEPPPSLVNIFAELEQDLGIKRPNHGDLETWARNGVLLLNTTLTVRARRAASHQGHGWETFTDEVIRCVNAKDDRVVFILWGARSPTQARPDRHSQALHHRVRPSIAALRAQRILRNKAVQQSQRGPDRSRPGPGRLAHSQSLSRPVSELAQIFW